MEKIREQVLNSNENRIFTVEKKVHVQGKVPITLYVEAETEDEAVKKAESMSFNTYREQQYGDRSENHGTFNFNICGLSKYDLDDDDYDGHDDLEEYELPCGEGSYYSMVGWMNATHFLRAQRVMEVENPTGEWIVDVVMTMEDFLHDPITDGKPPKTFMITYRDFGLEHPQLDANKDRVIPSFQGCQVGDWKDKTGSRGGNHYEVLNDYGMGSLFFDAFPEMAEYYHDSRMPLQGNGKPETYFQTSGLLFRIRKGSSVDLPDIILGEKNYKTTVFECSGSDFYKMLIEEGKRVDTYVDSNGGEDE